MSSLPSSRIIPDTHSDPLSRSLAEIIRCLRATIQEPAEIAQELIPPMYSSRELYERLLAGEKKAWLCFSIQVGRICQQGRLRDADLDELIECAEQLVAVSFTD